MAKRIAFQGELGAYGHQACVEARPGFEPLPCHSFDDAIRAVRSGEADLGMIAVENSTYGRVADVHHLLPQSGLHIVDEAFVRVHINLLAKPGARLEQIETASGHTVILPQCATFLRQNSITPRVSPDNARAARDVASGDDMTAAALASELAAEIYGLDVLARNIEDHDKNTTRFLVMARDIDLNRRGDHGMVTSFVFRVRNISAALYKAMGGFATNGVNMTKLESYMVGGSFHATQFFAEVEGHPDDRNLQLALEELDYFTDMVKLMGVYPASPRRKED
ncbi:prephenate dehydratase [Ponticoccus sp. SC2-23]|uniref:prephenate dehydratase n=1 Tax=Alexandriicola marinus TaxID=2081710 RepID=UPI000FDB0AA9|nr:prephenate dehydratase [Alexandriicola marinus]MBM1220257.1 prephenate dehydratase [Ponticoccus sp. SC6-9]MBM1224943.1 prephenate dehydratase [Ponticoccus sp. SC6-15]MBM1228457.1 prephenate dehydratase [Ponticoccus sp. SC6-38]MBM1233906.1 prephenate dehydratase [Ponticoccus sp. SC6-45]MBM1238958.1 prephenate dehydratase [Ponticoccus sp. SC6-49]MBM1242740.1 prephenate dehydratase [Ponticoccus sp. SC2-64]MBM1247430.1 prephenate dehydratase [Ponticoccus sp. SC6-42]MBM1251911.1 prephenate de